MGRDPGENYLAQEGHFFHRITGVCQKGNAGAHTWDLALFCVCAVPA